MQRYLSSKIVQVSISLLIFLSYLCIGKFRISFKAQGGSRQLNFFIVLAFDYECISFFLYVEVQSNFNISKISKEAVPGFSPI